MEIHIYSINVLPFILVNLVFTSTKTDASCFLPEDLTNAAWEYNYTDVSDSSEQSTTLNIATTTLQNSVINLNAFGTIMNDWTCINSLNISNTQTLVVFKSDTSFSSSPFSGNRRLYLCMKFTKVTNDLYYFHLLSDIETSVFPNERVFMSEAGNAPTDEAPMCSTFCQYTDSLKIRTLRRPGTNDVLPNDAALCEPCDSACVVESTEFSDTAPKRTTSAELYRTTIMTTESTLESVKTPISSSTYFTESTKFERTAPTRTTPLDASCVLPEDLKNAVWEYNYTDVASNSEQSTTLNIGTTTLQNSVINLNVFGTTIRDWTCINSLNISNAQKLVVFKSDTSFTSGPSSGNRRLYLCMKFTKVTNDLYYFHLLSDIETSVFPNERVFMSEAGNAPSDEAPMCSTFCQYTDSLKIRTLRRPGTNDVLPNGAALCEPCGSACVVESTEFSDSAPKRTTSAELDITTIMTTESTLESVTTPTSSFTYFTESTAPTGTTPLESTEFSDTAPKRTTAAELDITTIMTTESTLESVTTPTSSFTYFTESTAPTGTTPLDASCVLPEDLKNAVWEYNYTDVSDSSEQSTTLNIGTTTLQNSVINLNAFGTAIRDWTCINSLNISNAQKLVVFKSDTSFTSGPSSGNKRLYLCMKFTKVTNDLYYFHLLSDIETGVFPNERVFMSEAGNPPADEAPMCSTFCQYTDSLKIRTLRRPGTNDVLPNDASLCEPCDSACDLDSIHHCVDNLDRFDTKWNRTAENTLVTVSCTGEYTGTVSRNCSSGGMWNEPDYTQCISKSIKNIKTQLDKLLVGDSEFPLVSSILGNLENVTSANNELRTGDLVTASALLEDIAKYVTNHTDEISVDQLENFGSICNDLLEEKYHQSWEEQKDKGTSGITTVVKAVTDYNSVFHNVLDGEFSMLVNKENIVIEVGKTSSAEIIVPDRLQTNDSWIIDSGTEMKLKKNMCSDLTGYSCTFYRNISSLFPKQLLLNREVQPFDGIYDVNSIIADVSIEAESCSDYSLDLRFGHILGNHSRPVCGFWEFNASNTVNGAWSSFGSLVVESTDSYTICEYNHTTNFAILMSPERTPSPDNFPLSLISAIGCAISILFLFITIVVHLVLWRYVRTDRSKTLMNLCVAFILSYVLFLAGITRTENKAVCTAIAVALHYMFLTDFALMLAEGILIVRMVIIVFPTKSIVHWLLPACWVVPGIIVGISAGVTKLNGYGNEQFCWLTLDSNLIWAFIGPALIVILINFVIIVLTVHKMMTTKGLARKTLEEKSRIGIESICVILPLFGITWVLGAFSVNEDLVMFQYLFAIFNSLQGLFICLFHCFFNKQVKQGYYHFQRRRKANWSNIVVSTDTSNYYTHTRQQRNSNGIFTQSKEQENRTTYRYASQSLIYGN